LITPALYLSLVLVTLGIGLGLLIYRRARQTDPLERSLPQVFRFLEHRMWLDEFYDWTVLALARFAAGISDFLDRYLWDGLFRLVAALGRWFGSLTKGLDERAINGGVNEATDWTRRFGRGIAYRHSGQVQSYLGTIALAMVALLILLAWLS
jgi:NADH-quinone oxidoreductase subunit L